MNTTIHEHETVRATVREGYGRIATQGGSCCGAGCGSGKPHGLAEDVGYTAEELAALPDGADMGLSCGNPMAIASLQPGDVVLDLGSGGGFDVFIAGRKVGPTGRVIGVDMTPEMVAKARRNIPASGLENVEFRLGEIEHLPVADASVDVVISNCVLNLSPDKAQVWREIARALKPGGRVAIADLALLRPLPDAVRQSVEALVGCMAGAVTVAETDQLIRAAGLEAVRLESRSHAMAAMTDWNDPLYQEVVATLPAAAQPADYVTSLAIAARKPQAPAAASS